MVNMSQKNKTLLIIDNSQDSIQALRNTLDQDYRVLSAETEDQALNSAG